MTQYYLCLNVRGFLQNNKFPRDYERMFKHDDGRSMTAAEAHDALLSEIASGHEVIPMSPNCGNPCSMPKCKGFHYAGDGCPGHE